MAVVAATPTPETKTVPAHQPLWVASLFGALYLLATLAVIFYGIPQLWKTGVSPLLGESFVDFPLRMVAQLGAAILLAMFGISLAGPSPIKGLRGGIFWTTLLIGLTFFISRQLALWIGQWFRLDLSSTLAAWGVVALGLAVFGVMFLRGSRFQNWSVGLQDGGWFQASSYKKMQGLKVRRFTMLGLIFLFGTGIYALMIHQLATAPKNWVLTTPFLPAPLHTIVLLPAVKFSLPFILAFLAVWVAFRAVNMPSFADFLIATEAEINKVSWTPRAELVRDTIVVLIVTFIITLFLLLVDLFWGWILSREIIRVLPSDEEQQSSRPADVDKLDY